jgi:hypothetical protein
MALEGLVTAFLLNAIPGNALSLIKTTERRLKIVLEF